MEKVNQASTSIKEWASDDRPREKLHNKGVYALSDAELLAILIRTGTKKSSAVDLARELLQNAGNNLNELGKLTTGELQKVKGIGHTKSITLLAALELGRRRHAGMPLQKTSIHNSNDIAVYLRTVLKDYAFEVFAVLFLNRANKVNHFEIISKGGITGTVADPRIILKKALDAQATAIVLSHNHPSGNLKPSRADEDLTQKIKLAASFLDIKVLDHVIVSDEGYFSFADEGII